MWYFLLILHCCLILAGEEVVTALGSEVDRLEKEIQELVPGIRHVDIEAHNPGGPSPWKWSSKREAHCIIIIFSKAAGWSLSAVVPRGRVLSRTTPIMPENEYWKLDYSRRRMQMWQIVGINYYVDRPAQYLWSAYYPGSLFGFGVYSSLYDKKCGETRKLILTKESKMIRFLRLYAAFS